MRATNDNRICSASGNNLNMVVADDEVFLPNQCNGPAVVDVTSLGTDISAERLVRSIVSEMMNRGLDDGEEWDKIQSLAWCRNELGLSNVLLRKLKIWESVREYLQDYIVLDNRSYNDFLLLKDLAGFRAGSFIDWALKANCARIVRTTRHLDHLANRLRVKLREAFPEVVLPCVNAPRRLPGFVSVALSGRSGEGLVHVLDLKGIAVSAGAACDSRNTQVSHVLKAIQLPMRLAKGVVRISLGCENTVEDVDRITTALNAVVGGGDDSDAITCILIGAHDGRNVRRMRERTGRAHESSAGLQPVLAHR